jgi:hypothetical protein
MADNYLQFSFMLENITPEGLLFYEEECQKIVDREGYCDWQWEAEDGNRLWIYAETYGNPYDLAEILAEYLAKFDPEGAIVFSWSMTCSKPRLDEFSGGAVAIIAGKFSMMDAASWANTEVANMQIERGFEDGPQKTA